MRNLIIMTAATVIFFASTPLPVMAQNDEQPASQSMQQAGTRLKEAAANAGSAAADAYHGTSRAIEDTAITTRVMLSLRDDKIVGKKNIQVHTIVGVVTLSGDVPSQASAERAQQIAMQTQGVRGVNNQLTVNAASAAD